MSAQRQVDDLRSRLADAQSNWQLAQAAADAAGQERMQLLQHVEQELNRASLVEQVCVCVFTSRTVCSAYLPPMRSLAAFNLCTKRLAHAASLNAGQPPS